MSNIQVNDTSSSTGLTKTPIYPSANATIFNYNQSVSNKANNSSDLTKLIGLVTMLLQQLIARLNSNQSTANYLNNNTSNLTSTAAVMSNNGKNRAAAPPSTVIILPTPLPTNDKKIDPNTNPFLYKDLCNSLLNDYDDNHPNASNLREEETIRRRKAEDDNRANTISDTQARENFYKSQPARVFYDEKSSLTIIESNDNDNQDNKNIVVKERHPTRKTITLPSGQGEITIMTETDYWYNVDKDNSTESKS